MYLADDDGAAGKSNQDKGRGDHEESEQFDRHGIHPECLDTQTVCVGLNRL
jgi:hypothetical protein